MGAPIAIKIENADQIKRAFIKAPALMTKYLSMAIKAAVFLIEGKSMQNTPVLTGRLRGSHYTNFKPMYGEVGTNTNYDKFVHEGTKFMPGRPYLRDAVDDSNVKINEMMLAATQKVLNDIGKASS